MYRALGDVQQTAQAAFSLGVAAEDRGDYAAPGRCDRGARGQPRAREPGRGLVPDPTREGRVRRGRPAAAAALGEEARALARELGDLFRRARQPIWPTWPAPGGNTTARPRGRQEFSRTGWLAWAEWPESAAGGATLAAAGGEAEQAARLFGAAAAARAEVGIALTLPERAVYEQAAEAAKARLGEAAFTVAWTAGRAAGTAAALADVEAVLAGAAGTPRHTEEASGGFD